MVKSLAVAGQVLVVSALTMFLVSVYSQYDFVVGGRGTVPRWQVAGIAIVIAAVGSAVLWRLILLRRWAGVALVVPAGLLLALVLAGGSAGFRYATPASCVAVLFLLIAGVAVLVSVALAWRQMTWRL